MVRGILAIIVGFVLWSVIWVGGNAVVLADAGSRMAKADKVDDPAELGVALGLSIACSLIAGLAAGLIAGRPSRAPLILAGLLLLVGAAVQSAVWNLMPAWYHAAFLVLLVPITLLGARLAGRRRAAPAPVPA